jgi:hypothetical protein
MRRTLALALSSVTAAALTVVLVAAVVLARGGTAAAQEPALRLTLLEQTPQWNGPDDTSLMLRVRAQNTGAEPLEDLRIGITLWPPVFSRTGFEQSLSADPGDAAPLLAETRTREGSLAPGDVRDFEVPVDLPVEQLSATQSLIYPLKLDVRTGYRSLAAIRTPVIYLVRRPIQPLALSWTFVLDAPLELRPDGVFGSPAVETSASRGGRTAGEIAALSRLAESGVGVDVAVSPMLLLQLQQMADGYRVVDGGSVRSVEAGTGGSAAASGALDRLRTIASAPNVELSALPYSEPLLPALTSGDLARDLGVQLQGGREIVADLLGRTPSTNVLRPPASAIDEATLDELPGAGVSTLLLDPDAVPRTEDTQGFAPSPVVSLAAQNATLSAVVADPAAQALLDTGIADRDPVLASQAVLGELASIWLQRPGEPHGVAMVFGQDGAAPAAFYGPLVRGIASAPWLTKRTASSLVGDEAIPRAGGTAQIVPSTASFGTEYVDELRRARRRVETLRTMLVDPSDEPAHLDRLLLLAESRRFIGDETSGFAFIHRVDSTVAPMFGAVRPQVSQPITLTSRAIRDVPIAVRNVASVPLRVTIRLWSQYLRGTFERTRILPARSTETIAVDLELRTTGRFPVQIDVLAPSGRPIGHRQLIVRSTAYNRIALMITIGAALLAFVVWARRFVPRRNG